MGNCLAAPSLPKEATLHTAAGAKCPGRELPLTIDLKSDELSILGQLPSSPAQQTRDALGASVPNTAKLRSASQPKQLLMISSNISEVVMNSSDSAWQSCEVSVAELLAGMKLTRPFAHGGQGCVFLGTWHGVNRVAIKLVVVRGRAGEALRAPAFREVLFAKCLSHPNIVRTHDVRTCTVTQEFIDQHTAAADSDSAPAITILPSPDVTQSQNELEQQQQQQDHYCRQQQQQNRHHPDYVRQQQQRNQPQAAGRALDDDGLESQGQLMQCIAPAGVSLDQSFDSRDGFGRNDVEDKAEGMDWSEIIQFSSMRAGDHVAIIVMDLCTMGNLLGAIQKGLFGGSSAASTDGNYSGMPHDQANGDPLMAAIRDRALLRTAFEIAMAMHYLHLQDVVHGDIKPMNVLLTGSRQDRRGFTPLLGDFGLSRVLGLNKQAPKEGRPVGTLQYMAPEIHSSQSYSPASDVYAFGILLYEMASGQAAYKHVENRGQLQAGVQLWGLRPEWPRDRLPELGEWYRRCVHEDPGQRPTAEQLVDALKRIERHVRHSSHQARAAAGAEQEQHRQQYQQQRQQQQQQQQQRYRQQ